ncbi:MAG TPA: RHS repeat-associated core domain-containing protein [Terriglobales bacterium]|nr:RHS repeat-associated core domain-containing protein [Terriglobales bacterium]
MADAIYYVQDGAPVDSFTWTPEIQSAGDYQLYARWTASSANSGAAQYTVVHGGGTSLVTVSQKQNGGQWNLLGTWSFAPGAGHQVTLTASSDGNVVADAIKLVGTGPAPANLVYLHTDQIGLPQKITDATQAVVWDRVQDPFGRQVSLTSSGGIDTALRFPGQQADPDTGFAYNYYRDYDPTLGRYVQADPIGLAGGINRYVYANDNPTGYADPKGQNPLLLCLANPLCRGAVTGTAIAGADVAYQLWRNDWQWQCVNWHEAGDAFLQGFFLANALPELRPIWGALRAGGGRLLRDSSGGLPKPGAAEEAGATGQNAIGVGNYANESIAARSTARDFTSAERAEINRIGSETGCHTCGTTNPGTKSGSFIPDHQPPSALNPSGQPQRLYPQCLSCSREQGLAIARQLQQRGP